ncbi:MAG TPA: hypothetical protein PKE49_17465 [Leptospiraceae bacterium]|jgi:hypothetical protein|nr:hypothetical protein [Leptospiraceae bacterium]HMX58319.1 hypothetical protein [Leptospiraceae bacterium]HNL02201.1 hypothetical protein [Leptospiraceae bacterium]HNL68049.1 hypothetical protein [Leptospiraceae bacterium]HNN75192.1 hypothetical protein [Leptospiraceae bacterium]
MRKLAICLSLFVLACSSREVQVPEDTDLTEGMISSSTYQVVLSAFGADEQEARKRGEEDARRKTYMLILREPFFRGTLSEEGKRQIRTLIETRGRVVSVQKEAEGAYRLIFQVTQPGGLRNTFRSIR